MQKLELMRKFSLEDKKIFEKAYSSLKFPLAEHSFAWLCLWDDCYKDMEWEEINGNLCLFLTFEGNRYVWGPVFPGNRLGETLSKCFSLCENYSVNSGIAGKPALLYVPEELKEKYASLDGFKLKAQNRDYVYKTSDIMAFKGKKHKDKRNKRNFFIKNYRFAVEGYSEEKHKNGCTDLLERWNKQKETGLAKGDKGKFLAEIASNRKAFELAEKLGIRGMVVLVDGRVEGYIFGERTNRKICTMFLGKTNLTIKGLSQFIYSEFLRKYFGDAEFVNDGEDWDVGYLEHSKLSYKPKMVRKSYMLVKS